MRQMCDSFLEGGFSLFVVVWRLLCVAGVEMNWVQRDTVGCTKWQVPRPCTGTSSGTAGPSRTGTLPASHQQCDKATRLFAQEKGLLPANIPLC
ncbi:hypothetical protein BGZ61DRAFT_73934 [Ilyonectria robusta]|uniref:uncharacterized protein n=1 Tax=Ilyonectria robusta TaxID=1079257 RepID=UPI001E8DD8F5|nr:uncharacterized protein BGZ61DRAFT_73934 [Ilyonectria robusta]KAH8677046.1 hypothetical protein BGZ61DRAFT_73934 [Ilyonectria robusta]